MNPSKTPTQLRLTHDLLERADALIAVMAADPAVPCETEGREGMSEV